jgi:hypothetical protein
MERPQFHQPDAREAIRAVEKSVHAVQDLEGNLHAACAHTRDSITAGGMRAASAICTPSAAPNQLIGKAFECEKLQRQLTAQ